MNLTLETLRPVLTRADEGAWIDLGDHRARAILNSAQTQNAFLLAEMEVDGRGGVPPHVHEREDETFLVLAGQIEVTVGEQTFCLDAGDTAFAPRNIAHTWHCTSEGGARVLLLITPGANFESFALKMSALNIVPSDPDSFAALVALTREHGLTMLTPVESYQ